MYKLLLNKSEKHKENYVPLWEIAKMLFSPEAIPRAVVGVLHFTS